MCYKRHKYTADIPCIQRNSVAVRLYKCDREVSFKKVIGVVSLGMHPRAGRALSLTKLAGFLVTWCVASPAISQDGYTYSLFGTVGLLDMPTAESADDAELATSFNLMS